MAQSHKLRCSPNVRPSSDDPAQRSVNVGTRGGFAAPTERTCVAAPAGRRQKHARRRRACGLPSPRMRSILGESEAREARLSGDVAAEIDQGLDRFGHEGRGLA